MTIKTKALLKQDGKFEYLYLIDVPVFFAKIQEPALKFGSTTEKEYQITAFVDEATREMLEDEVKINKQLFLVGKDKNKKREVKYKLSTQVEEGVTTHYDEVKGLHGISLSVNEFTKKGNPSVVTVLDKDNKPFTENVGNGSICSIKLFGYRNQDDLLVVMLNTVKVTEHVPFEGGGGAGGTVKDDVFGEYQPAVASTPQTTEPAAKPQAPQADDSDLDDDIPF